MHQFSQECAPNRKLRTAGLKFILHAHVEVTRQIMTMRRVLLPGLKINILIVASRY